MSKEISLTKGYVTLVDDEDYDELTVHKWNATKPNTSGRVYARRTVKVKGKHTTLLMHRVILRVQNGMLVDHKDGDGLNNQRYNIRVATRANNCSNITTSVQNKSGLKGVKVHYGKYQARIRANNACLHLGTFDTPEEAHQAYCNAARKYHGEFASFGA